MKALLLFVATTALASDPKEPLLYSECLGYSVVLESKPVIKITKKKNPEGTDCIVDKVVIDLDELLDNAEVKISPENQKKLLPNALFVDEKDQGMFEPGWSCWSTLLACSPMTSDCNTTTCNKRVCKEDGECEVITRKY